MLASFAINNRLWKNTSETPWLFRDSVNSNPIALLWKSSRMKTGRIVDTETKTVKSVLYGPDSSSGPMARQDLPGRTILSP